MNILLLLIFVGAVCYAAYRARGDDYFLSTGNSDFAVGISYGATFISTSAIIGFGGLAAWTGFGTMALDLTFAAIMTYLATIYIGPKVWEANQKHKARTFVQLIGLHFNSPLLSKALAALVLILVPFYCTAVLIGVGKLISTFTSIDYVWAVAGFAALTSGTVLYGGMKSVLRNDALQGSIMGIGALIVLVITLATHVIGQDYVANLNAAFASLADDDPLNRLGFNGYFSLADFLSRGWLMIVTLCVFTIPVGMIALPQLQTRFMLAESKDSFKGIATWGVLMPLAVVGTFLFVGITANSFYWQEQGLTAIAAAKGTANIIPQFLNDGFPSIVGSAVFLVILAAAFTTLNSLMHLMSTTISNDIIDSKEPNLTWGYAAIAVIVGLAIYMTVNFDSQPAIIARVTAIYFGVLGSALLPSIFALALGSANRMASLWSFGTGGAVALFWILFVHAKESKLFTGTTLLDLGAFNFTEAIVPGLVVSLITYYIVAKQTKAK